jgi:hypothetical protein
MKDAVLPHVRVASEVRAGLHAVLRQRETLSEFVETSVGNAIEYRRGPASFQARGEAAWQRHLHLDDALPAGDVMARLQAKLDAQRQKLTLRAFPSGSALPRRTILLVCLSA